MLPEIVSFVAGGIFNRNMRIQKLRIAIIFFFIVSFFSLSYASVNIPLDSSFYTDIDILISQGLIKSSISSTQPFTRDEAGRLLAEAVDYSEIDKIPSSFSKILNRMVEDYDEEISEARIRGSAPGTFIKPLDEFSMHYNFLNGPFSMFNNEGINYFDGSNAIIQFQSRARLWRVFSFYIQPLYIYN